ncbi:hypothetical protein Tco_0709223 [Tanacetum coccineum]
MKVHKGKRSGHLVDEEDKEPQPAFEPQVEDNEYNLQRGSTRPTSSCLKARESIDDTSANVVRDTPSPADAETGADTEKSNSGVMTNIRMWLKNKLRKFLTRWAVRGNNLLASHPMNPMHKRLRCYSLPVQVHESVKHTTEEHVHLENPPSSSGTLSSMKNLDDAFTFGDQFLNDKPSKKEPGKANVETKVNPWSPFPIQSASSISFLPLSTFQSINLTHPKHVSPRSCLKKPYLQQNRNNNNTSTTTTSTTTKTRLLKLFPYRVYTLENHDLYSNIDKYVNEMKEILHDRMLEISSYRSHPEHTTLYEALEASMDHKNKEEFIEEMAKSLLSLYEDFYNKSSSFQLLQAKIASPSELPVDDIPIPDDVYLSDSKDTGVAHLPKIKTRPDWLKPLPEEGRHHKHLNQSGDKERRNALLISKLKAAYYPDFGLEELVPSLRIKSERDYDISAAYGISHWISEADFKNLHPNDFEDMYLLHLQGKLNHLSGANKVHLFNAVNLWIRNIVIRQCVEDLKLGIESYQTKLNLTQPRWNATDFLFKEDYTIVHKPRAIIYRDKNNQKKMMRETELTLAWRHTILGLRMIKGGVKSSITKLIERKLKIRTNFQESVKAIVIDGYKRDVDNKLIQSTK